MDFLLELEKLLQDRKSSLPAGSYTAKLFSEGRDRILKKVGEESAEVIIAAKNDRQELIHESADLLFHLLLLLVQEGIDLDEILEELKCRLKSRH